MSPTEFELRAALRFGEGDDEAPDADAIVRRAGDLRRQRRARIGGGLAAAAVVAGVAVTAGVLTNGDSRRNDNSSSAAGGAATAPNKAPSDVGAQGASRGTATLGAPASGDVAGLSACPSTAPRLLLPGGGGSGQFGATDSLLATDVTTVVVCGYGAAETPHAPTATTIRGAAARALVASLDGAPAVHQGVCPQFRTGDTTQFVLVGITADGRRGAPVVVTLGANPCQSQATNGTAVRYGWVPPTSSAAAFPLEAPTATTSVGTAPTPQRS